MAIPKTLYHKEEASLEEAITAVVKYIRPAISYDQEIVGEIQSQTGKSLTLQARRAGSWYCLCVPTLQPSLYQVRGSDELREVGKEVMQRVFSPQDTLSIRLVSWMLEI